MDYHNSEAMDFDLVVDLIATVRDMKDFQQWRHRFPSFYFLSSTLRRLFAKQFVNMNYPYTLPRGVVSEQLVERSDVPFFWHPHKLDERIVQKVLSNCYGIETIQLNSLDATSKAKSANLPSWNKASQSGVVLRCSFKNQDNPKAESEGFVYVLTFERGRQISYTGSEPAIRPCSYIPCADGELLTARSGRHPFFMVSITRRGYKSLTTHIYLLTETTLI